MLCIVINCQLSLRWHIVLSTVLFNSFVFLLCLWLPKHFCSISFFCLASPVSAFSCSFRSPLCAVLTRSFPRRLDFQRWNFFGSFVLSIRDCSPYWVQWDQAGLEASISQQWGIYSAHVGGQKSHIYIYLTSVLTWTCLKVRKLQVQ